MMNSKGWALALIAISLGDLFLFAQGKPSCESCNAHKKKKGGGRSMGGGGSKDAVAKLVADFNVTLPKSLDEATAARIMEELEPWVQELGYQKALLQWDFVTNINPETEAAALAAGMTHTNFIRDKFFPLVSSLDWRNYKDPTLKRRVKAESLLGVAALSEDKVKKMGEVGTKITKIYSTATVCDFKNPSVCNLALDPTLTEIMDKSRDPEELKHYWVSWREKAGKPQRELYPEFISLQNEVARLNGYTDGGELNRRSYEDPLMPFELSAVWGQLRPLYENLHAYVRRKLREFYGNKIVKKTGPIPAHLLGNMWAQKWNSIWDILRPFPPGADIAELDVTPKMKEKNYTPDIMYKKADDFFQSLGLPAPPEVFWQKSVFEKPVGREMVCHPEAWDLNNGKDFRIKMCAVVTKDDFVTVHHEMGHIQYDMHYKVQPSTFREGANPGFHEAIGDTIGMSVASPAHLQNLGLLSTYKDDEVNTISFLLFQALQTVVDLPWALLLEKWRWDVYSGAVNASQYNCHWWTLRTRIQGVAPPVHRSWEDFDPGAKYHVPSNTPYERYFVASILTFMFHETLCKEAGQFDPKNGKPLHLCSIYGSKAAGKKLAAMLSAGSSVHWSVTLDKMTGTNRLDALPLLNYYAPLMEWLKKDNEQHGEDPGWESGRIEDICTEQYQRA